MQRKTLRKAFGIIFNCLSAMSVYFDLLGYDIENFLMVFRQFVSIRLYSKEFQPAHTAAHLFFVLDLNTEDGDVSRNNPSVAK